MRRCLCLLFIATLRALGANEPAPLDFNRYLEGKYLYERHCLICHGSRGDGKGEMAATLVPRPRSFREGQFKFRTTPWGALPTDDDLRHTIKYGLTGTAMGMFSQLSDEEISALIQYVKSFSRRWRKAENNAAPLALPAPPAWLSRPTEVVAHAARGATLFQTHCAACHGATANGQGPVAVALKDLWGQASRPSDLRQPHLRCGDRPQDIDRVLVTGLNGTPMISFASALSPEQRWDLIAWILSQRLPEVPTLSQAPPR